MPLELHAADCRDVVTTHSQDIGEEQLCETAPNSVSNSKQTYLSISFCEPANLSKAVQNSQSKPTKTV